MEIRFRTRRLQRQFENYAVSTRDFGEQLARKYIQRIKLIKKTKNVAELTRLPGLGFHPLKGKRKRQYAIKLTGYYRLIVSIEEGLTQIICIEEVSDHYGD